MTNKRKLLGLPLTLCVNRGKCVKKLPMIIVSRRAYSSRKNVTQVTKRSGVGFPYWVVFIKHVF